LEFTNLNYNNKNINLKFLMYQKINIFILISLFKITDKLNIYILINNKKFSLLAHEKKKA